MATKEKQSCFSTINFDPEAQVLLNDPRAIITASEIWIAGPSTNQTITSGTGTQHDHDRGDRVDLSLP
jgi:hypothetical protein